MQIRGLIRRVGAAAVLIGIGLAGGYVIGTSGRGEVTADPPVQAAASSAQRWYCSMHPQIVRDRPGLCPICEMELIPMPENAAAEAGARELVVSEAAARLMEIQTSPVQRRFATNEVRMVGKVQYDETRVKHIAAWVPGRLDRLFVDFTGTTVRKGDHLVRLYSPELISTQAELLQAAKTAKDAEKTASEYLTKSVTSTLQAAREKLRLLGLTPEQVAEIERSGAPVTHLTIYSPMGGVVIQKLASEGMYVETGTQIYTVADLSQVWVKLDAYESDLSWIRYGQKVQFTTEAYPGETFTGQISFIDPVLDPMTRTAKVRVEVPNTTGRLKPEMFVRAGVHVQMARDGQVADPNLAGKWISPMHPSVVKSGPGTCDICGMDLVPAESLGYVAAGNPDAAPLVIPETAPLITGKRAVVYVQQPDTPTPTFVGREIVLGPRAGDYYVVESGLQEGEQVVTRGNFKIDAALQIQGKPSMMNPEGTAVPAEHQHAGHTPAPQAASALAAATKPATTQETCPVMGGPINKDIFVEYEGQKVYFCCQGCPAAFLADPQKYLSKLPQFQAPAQKPPSGTTDGGHMH